MRYSRLLLLLLVCLPGALRAELSRQSLDGTWNFAIDPVDAGIAQEWFKPGLVTERWDKVTVPHCYTVDPRYHSYTGTAWYFRTFSARPPAPGERVFLRFEAIFYQVEIWLNGRRLGAHEGGYTPFELDATALLGAENSLAIRVNNAWSTTTIPGAKTKVDYQSLNYGQAYPWMNYGGIVRPVALVVRPDVFIARVKIEATPDLAAGGARIAAAVFVRNVSNRSWTGTATLQVRREGKDLSLRLEAAGQTIAANGEAVLRIAGALAPAEVALWSFDHPALYEAEIDAGRDTVKTAFGIRSVTMSGTKLLLNGEPVSLGGANRPLDNPGLGSIDPPAAIERDLRLMKSAGLELSRITHYPVSPELLDWADRHGMMIIAEAGNWQMTPAQMADPVMREKFRSQMREMVERDWNHPSVVAWSLGNEYPSQTEEGKAWTRDMRDFTRSLDDTRLITFASNIAARPGLEHGEDEASQYVDFVSANIYDHHLEALRRIHALFPHKPVYVSEFGIRADAVADESERIVYLRQAMADFRQCADWIVGASIWTFNDYASLFPGSNPNGYRPWGLVTPERELRGMYRAAQEEFCPAVIDLRPRAGGGTEVVVRARDDFPRYTLRGYRLRVGRQTFTIDSLEPGKEIAFPLTDLTGASVPRIVLEKPNGFEILSKEAR
jgi:beta-glucuronidase